jgi:hypothetical protein
VKITLHSPLNCPGCDQKFKGTWVPNSTTADQTCPACGHAFTATWPRLGLGAGAGHPARGHAVPAAPPAVSGLTLVQLHAGTKSVGSDPEDPLLSVLPFTQRVTMSVFITSGGLEAADLRLATCLARVTIWSASQPMWRIPGMSSDTHLGPAWSLT